MLPYNLDPRWYEITWYGVPTRTKAASRPNVLVRIGLSGALVIVALLALGQVI
jgi:hypothetical protein